MEESALVPPPIAADWIDPVISEPYDSDEAKASLLQEWRKHLDALQEGRISWDHFFSLLPTDSFQLIDHPVLEAVTSKGGQSLLHLAVQQVRSGEIAKLSSIPALRVRRNSFGLTAYEFARYLDRKELANLIHQRHSLSFLEQPNVEIEKTPHSAALDRLDYLPHPVYESSAVLETILEKAKKAKASDSVDPEKIWMGIYFDKEIQSELHPKVAIRWIDSEVGFGLFAAQRIPSCSFVGEYTGVVQERKKKHLKDKYYCVRYTTWETGRKKFVLDAEKRGNFTRFINHSSRPNLGLQSVYWRGLPRMIFISLREISEGAQLTFDYGNFFWKECQQTPKNLY